MFVTLMNASPPLLHFVLKLRELLSGVRRLGLSFLCYPVPLFSSAVSKADISIAIHLYSYI